MNVPFKVGDWLVCDCGAEGCEPFQVTTIEDFGTKSVIIEGTEDSVYLFPEDYQLRLCTPLEKLL